MTNPNLIKIVRLAMCLVLLATVSSRGKTYVIFRYDDLAADAPGVRDSDTGRRDVFEAEKAVDGLFLRFGFPYVVAIIPAGHSEYAQSQSRSTELSFGDDPEKGMFLRQAIVAQRVEIAQHGYRHDNHVKEGHRPAEFRERSFEQQLEDINAGKAILQQALDGCAVETFVPPWNGWNSDTFAALKSAGFKTLSADCRYSARALEDLAVVPFTCQLWELESLLDEVPPDRDSIIVILYHPPQIASTGVDKTRFFGVLRFEKLLEKISQTPSVEVTTFAGLLSKDIDLSKRRYQVAHDLDRLKSFWDKLLPSHLMPGQSCRFEYVEAEVYAKHVRHWRLLTAAFVAGLVLAGAIVGGLMSWIIGRIGLYILIPLALGGLAASILKEVSLIERGYHVTGISAIPGLVAIGVLAGCGLAIIRRSIKRPKAEIAIEAQEA